MIFTFANAELNWSNKSDRSGEQAELCLAQLKLGLALLSLAKPALHIQAPGMSAEFMFQIWLRLAEI